LFEDPSEADKSKIMRKRQKVCEQLNILRTAQVADKDKDTRVEEARPLERAGKATDKDKATRVQQPRPQSAGD
jgi:hypothetical protein